MHSGWLWAHQRPLQVVGGHKAMAVADSALVDHGTVVRHLNGLADAGLASLHHAQFVRRVVYAQRCHFVTWKPLPTVPNTDLDQWSLRRQVSTTTIYTFIPFIHLYIFLINRQNSNFKQMIVTFQWNINHVCLNWP